MQAAGGTTPYAWSLASGSLPPGLALDAGTGAITGTPTASGTFGFTARVTDALGGEDTQALSIPVAGLVTVTQPPSSTTILAGALRAGGALEPGRRRQRVPRGELDDVGDAHERLVRDVHGRHERPFEPPRELHGQELAHVHAGRLDLALDDELVGAAQLAFGRDERGRRSPNLAPGGSAADYVSGAAGDGEVRVRVRCRRSGASFFTSGDLLRIGYVRPDAVATAVGPRLLRLGPVG